MDKEINFCPYCDAHGHKILHYNEAINFCRECDTFFRLEPMELICPKCESTNVGDSDFPSPAGEIILQCKKCKKMFSAKEFMEKNKIA